MLPSFRPYCLALLWACTCLCQRAVAQTNGDSLRAAAIDTLVKTVHAAMQATGRAFIDTTENGMRIYRIGGQEAHVIYYLRTQGDRVMLYGQNDSLVFASHKLSAPDIRAMPPPSVTYTYYYTNDTVFKTGTVRGGYGTSAIPFSPQSPGNGSQYPAEYRHYKKLLAAKGKQAKP